jgi:hypothetical protein
MWGDVAENVIQKDFTPCTVFFDAFIMALTENKKEMVHQ